MTCLVKEDIKGIKTGQDLFIVDGYEIKETYVRSIFIDGDFIVMVTGGRDRGGFETTENGFFRIWNCIGSCRNFNG